MLVVTEQALPLTLARVVTSMFAFLIAAKAD